MRKELVQIRCSIQEKENWQAKAKNAGMELSPWIRMVLDKQTSPKRDPGR